MNRILSKVLLWTAIFCSASTVAFAQGRGQGRGHDRGYDVFAGRDYRNNRWRNQNWKCGKFVNCHDARDGRIDGRGPRSAGFWRRDGFYTRGANVGYRNRYRMNDYWRRRHLMYRYDRWRWNR
ncbi:MAG TPA: hypothetical protein VKD91_18940 [Pyrinomonadaceae bacterium]|nr:hypothetical protein [Pyrinomonadaceae bacterium]